MQPETSSIRQAARSWHRSSAKAILTGLLTLGFTHLAIAEPWPEIKWQALIPPDWDPRAQFKGLDYSRLQDSDPRAMEALEQLRAAWDAAPTNPKLNGQRLRIAGFAIPLERKGEKVTEFLLVPYFGACIHSPPPPANQIIHATSAKPLADMLSMDAVWAYGTLSVQRRNTDWGVAGYRLQVDKIAPYEIPKIPKAR